MTTSTLSKAMRTLMLVAVLTPTPVLAGPATTAGQMLAQAQDHALKAEVGRLTARGRDRADAPAAISPDLLSVQRPGVIPASAVDANTQPTRPTPGNDDISASNVSPPVLDVADSSATAPKTDAAAAWIATPPAPLTANQIAIIPVAGPATPAAPVATTSQNVVVIAAVPAMPPASVVPTIIDRTATQKSAAAGRPERKGATDVDGTSGAVDMPAVKKTNVSTPTHQRSARANGVIEFDGVRIKSRQLQRIANRPELRSLLAQYGLN